MKSWVKDILSKIEVKLLNRDWEPLLSENIPMRSFPSPPGKPGRKYSLLGFEDQKNIWNDRADIIVKIYREPPERDKARVEIFCSGTDPKKIRYEGKEVLDYPGYGDTVVSINQGPKSKIGTVIFDVKI